MELIWASPCFVLSSAARAVDTVGIWSVIYSRRFVSPGGVLQVFLGSLKEHTHLRHMLVVDTSSSAWSYLFVLGRLLRQAGMDTC